MSFLNLIFYCAVVSTFIAFAFLLINAIKNNFASNGNTKAFPTKSLTFFITSIVVWIAVSSFMGSSAKNEALSFLNALSGNYTVYVNQKPVSNNDKIISALKDVSPQLGHHSHPTKRIPIDIKSEQGSLSLELRRDSEIPQEYWVFYYRDEGGTNTEIGKITTSIFDQY